ncbi:possible long-chain N-acyl amino acid synthase [Janthinobacterium sp. CG23_2]|nr:possible long-chain N-acyl amino acid synthase [Janthinobacterium sp. CG23_2]CUU30290.1 possible long-chain N-acyl amino acid synthase [Janthinobacterium sp. CG23_2]
MDQVLNIVETTRFNFPAPDVGDLGSHCVFVEDYSDNISEMTINTRSFGIRVADTEEGRNRASMLINKMYAWRGYAGTHRLEDNPNQITLSAFDGGEVIGTVTLGVDSPVGILADEVFKDHIDVFRARGAKVCEISKLAFDPTVRSKFALGSLFHILYIYAHHIYQCTDAFIEINPRHRRYYEHMLGFRTQSGVRINPRVDAPAHLLWLSLDFMGAEIERLGGVHDDAGTERSLYPYFFSKREEAGIADRLLSIG